LGFGTAKAVIAHPLMKSLVRIILFSLVSSLAFAAGSKVASDMPASTESGMVEVIVQYKTFAGVQTVDAAGPLGRVRRYFRSIPATHMTVPVSMLRSLASNPQVAYISPNRTSTGFLDATATQTVHADHVWSEGWDGTGVGVAIIDSGVALKADLATADGSTPAWSSAKTSFPARTPPMNMDTARTWRASWPGTERDPRDRISRTPSKA